MQQQHHQQHARDGMSDTLLLHGTLLEKAPSTPAHRHRTLWHARVLMTLEIDMKPGHLWHVTLCHTSHTDTWYYNKHVNLITARSQQADKELGRPNTTL
jgi:hypothetical protein